MNYLKQLPVSKLKIDRSFINDLGTGGKSDSIVRAVIALAHGLGMIVVAEGVETKAQLLGLLAYGCDQYQGYYCSSTRRRRDYRVLEARTAAAPEIRPRGVAGQRARLTLRL